MTSLQQTLIDIVRFLETERIPYMVIGGIAVSAWAPPRTTLDIDVTVSVEDAEIRALVLRLQQTFKLLVDEAEEFARSRRVLPLETATGGRIDLIFALLPFELTAIERARRLKIGDLNVRVCSPEDLIVHKIISERPRDREDVRAIITAQRESLDRVYLDPIVRDLARELGRPEIGAVYAACFDV